MLLALQNLINLRASGGGGAVSASSSAIEGADLSTAALSALESLASAAVEGVDVSAAVLSAVTAAAASNTENFDISAAVVSAVAAALSVSTDGADVSAATLSPSVDASSATIDGQDISAGSFTGTVVSNLSGAATEGFDTTSGALDNPLALTDGQAIEGQDLSVASAGPTGGAISIGGDSVEGFDTSAITGEVDWRPRRNQKQALKLIRDERAVITQAGSRAGAQPVVARVTNPIPQRLVPLLLPLVLETELAVPAPAPVHEKAVASNARGYARIGLVKARNGARGVVKGLRSAAWAQPVASTASAHVAISGVVARALARDPDEVWGQQLDDDDIILATMLALTE